METAPEIAVSRSTNSPASAVGELPAGKALDARTGTLRAGSDTPGGNNPLISAVMTMAKNVVAIGLANHGLPLLQEGAIAAGIWGHGGS